jgi:hypothetical protein
MIKYLSSILKGRLKSIVLQFYSKEIQRKMDIQKDLFLLPILNWIWTV